MFVSLIVGLFLCELAVRMFVTVRNVGPSFTVYDPVYGKRLKRSFTCKRIAPDFTMRFTTNSLGFRGPEPSAFPHRAILFIGDSFTMGYGVNDGEEYPALVGGILTERFGEGRPPIVNAAVGATGNGRWIKFLQAEAPKFDLVSVVIQVCGNDFEENVSEGLFWLSDDGGLSGSGLPPPPGLKRQVQPLVEALPGLAYSRLVSLFREARSRIPSGPGVDADRHDRTQPNGGDRSNEERTLDDQLTYRLLEKIIRICQEAEWPALVVLVEVAEHRSVRLDDILRQYDVPNIAIPRKTERPDLYHRMDGHWNAKGHAVVAELVATSLIDESLIR